jgi:hypothetical protein
MKKIVQLPMFALLFAFAILLSNCGKDADTIAIVKLIDENEIPINGAEVRLRGTSTFPGGEMPSPTQNIELDVTRTSNTNGEARFNFTDNFKAGQAGLFVLDVHAEFRGKIAKGIIKVEEHQVNRATVQFTPQ